MSIFKKRYEVWRTISGPSAFGQKRIIELETQFVEAFWTAKGANRGCRDWNKIEELWEERAPGISVTARYWVKDSQDE